MGIKVGGPSHFESEKRLSHLPENFVSFKGHACHSKEEKRSVAAVEGRARRRSATVYIRPDVRTAEETEKKKGQKVSASKEDRGWKRDPRESRKRVGEKKKKTGGALSDFWRHQSAKRRYKKWASFFAGQVPIISEPVSKREASQKCGRKIWHFVGMQESYFKISSCFFIPL